MGEVIKKLGTVRVKDKEYDVELNLPHTKSQQAQVHIQSNSVRLEGNETDFCRLVCSMLKARKKLMYLKSGRLG